MSRIAWCQPIKVFVPFTKDDGIIAAIHAQGDHLLLLL